MNTYAKIGLLLLFPMIYAGVVVWQKNQVPAPESVIQQMATQSPMPSPTPVPSDATKATPGKTDVPKPTSTPLQVLMYFWGDGCPHCTRMAPLISQLEKEMSLEVQKYETWKSRDNATLQKQYDDGYCGGVPFFYNKTSGKWICGETDYGSLKKWASGK